MLYFEITYIENSKKIIGYFEAQTKKDAIILAKSKIDGKIVKIKQIPYPISLKLENIKKKWFGDEGSE